MAEGYYEKAVSEENGGRDEHAREYYRKALTEWERVTTQCPETPYTTAHAYYFAGHCQSRLGERRKAIECFKEAVKRPDFEYAWHALFLVGRNYERLERVGAIPKSEAEPAIRAAYEQLVETHPNGYAAKIAKRWLSHHSVN
jgi:tetratricopeptide (TPR) repeat protein